MVEPVELVELGGAELPRAGGSRWRAGGLVEPVELVEAGAAEGVTGKQARSSQKVFLALGGGGLFFSFGGWRRWRRWGW